MNKQIRIEQRKIARARNNELTKYKCDVCSWRNARSCSGGISYCDKCLEEKNNE